MFGSIVFEPYQSVISILEGEEEETSGQESVVSKKIPFEGERCKVGGWEGG